MLLGLFILSAVLIKTSLLGLGWISIAIGLSGYLFCRWFHFNLDIKLGSKEEKTLLGLIVKQKLHKVVIKEQWKAI